MEKWQLLEKKLGSGLSLEEACSQCGVTTEEASQFLTAKRHLDDYDGDLLIRTAREVLPLGLETLKQIAIDPGKAVAFAHDSDSFRNMRDGAETEKAEYAIEKIIQMALDNLLDAKVKAAQSLVKYSLDVRKILLERTKASMKEKGAGEGDLWDVASQKPTNPWVFREMN